MTESTPEPKVRFEIKHTDMIGARVVFRGDRAWWGLPAGRYPAGERGTVRTVYIDPACPFNPVYTVALEDGVLVEVHSGHVDVAAPS